MPRISLVIPAFNEEKYLPDLLESVDRARGRYEAGSDQVEVIVADNGSTDGTAAVAFAYGCRVVPVATRAIAAARNGGGAAASGEIVAFVDADSIIHPETFNAIERTLTERVVVGATGVRMSRSSLGIELSMLVATALIRAGGLDSGVVFCRRSDWEAVGGYNEERLWAEDVQFLIDLKRLGKRRRQRFRRARSARTITSARKFDRFGDWHYFSVLFRGSLWLLFKRAAFAPFIRDYWYDGRR
jgi:glycosyltransferase involved in cell wall biosynthesis